jgi:chitinase
VAVLGDRVNESDETFVVNLSSAVHATIAKGQGLGAINNDDAPGFSIADLEIVEPVSGDRTVHFTVTLSPATGGTVDYSTSPGTATPGSDYEPPSGTSLSFAAGESTHTIDVIIHSDALTEGIETFQVNLANPSGATIANGQAIGRIHDPGNYFVVPPCRVLDTRNPSGPYGGPALLAGQSRTVTLAGQCGIPASAQAVSVNVAVTQPTAAGNLRLYPAGTPVPSVSSVNYSAGQTRANNGVTGLGVSGQIAIRCAQASGTVHAILDVTGYFE